MPRPLLTERISFGGFAALRLPFRVQASLKESNYIVADNDAAGHEPVSQALEPTVPLPPFQRSTSLRRTSGQTFAAVADLASGAVVSEE